jgi:U3 small nucleolar RNA-associated protein 12
MVKSYPRYIQDSVFGVISSRSNLIYNEKSNTVYSSALDSIIEWNYKTQTQVSTIIDTVTPGSLNSSSLLPPPEITRLAYSSFANLLAIGLSNGDIKVWDLSTNSVIIKFQGHKSAISCLEFDLNGTSLISGSNDTTIIIWDLISETGLIKFKGHKNLITSIYYFDENYLISTSKDGLIKIWDLKINQCIETHLAHNGESWSMNLFKYDNKDFLITTGLNGECKIWSLNMDLDDGHKLKEFGIFQKQSKNRVIDIKFDSLNQLLILANADKTVELFRLRTIQEIQKATVKRTKRLLEKGLTQEEINESLENSKINMLISPFTIIFTESKINNICLINSNSKDLNLLINNSNNTLNYWNIKLPENIKKHNNINDKISFLRYSVERPGHRNDIRSVDINDDDSLLYTGSNNQIKIWNLKTLNCIRSIEQIGNVLCGRFLPGGSLLVVGLKNGDLKLIDLSTSEIIHHIENAHKDSIWSIEITSDGKTILTGSSDKNVKYWEIKVNTLENKLNLSHVKTLDLNESIISMKISSDSKYLSVSLMDNTVKVFFFDTLKFYLSLYGHKLPVLSIDISFDSKMIITCSADKNIRIWGLDFGDCHKSIFAHDDSIMNIKFFPQSHNFLTCSKDKYIKYWDGDKFDQIQKFAAHLGEVWGLSISSDAEFFVSISHDFSIRVWKQDNDEVFIQEEREKEMDELYENELLTSLEGDDITPRRKSNMQDENEEDKAYDELNDVEVVRSKTIENLKASEKLIEALDMLDDGNNALLKAMNTTPSEYLFDTLNKVKPNQLEDCLLVLPFSYTVKLLKVINTWTKNGGLLQKNNAKLSIICRTLFFVVRSNHMELISQNDEIFKNEIISLKNQLRNMIKQTTRDIGFNVQGLKFLQNRWAQEHSHIYTDETDSVEQGGDSEKVRKRVYTTLA